MKAIDINRIAIIGAGPAGICAARHLHHNKYSDKKFDIVVYEKQDQVGGLWIYNKWDKQKEEKDISPIYKHLISNLPYQSIYYPDFPFPKSTPTFPSHEVILRYLQNYAKHFNVEQFIKFQTEVTLVSPLTDKDTTVNENGSDRFVKWKVESKDIQTGKKYSEEFDAVIMCNGPYWNPSIPSIDGIDNFKGEILHSKFYDDPTYYQNKDVVIYGNGPSAADIMRTICHICKRLFISTRTKLRYNGDHPDNVTVVENIQKINENGEIEFVNGEKINADVLIFCTGYIFQFPLTPESKVELKEDGKMVWPIYKNLFHAIYPSLIFPGLVNIAPTFSYFNVECSYITAILTGTIQLPSKTEMFRDLSNQKQIVKEEKRKRFHSLSLNGWNNNFPKHSSEENIPENIQKMFVNVIQLARKDCYKYKEMFVKEFTET